MIVLFMEKVIYSISSKYLRIIDDQSFKKVFITFYASNTR